MFLKKSKRKIKITGHHYRVLSLLSSFLVILIFNLIVAPLLGLSFTKASAATYIDTARLVDLANQSRSDNGLGYVKVDQRLINAATNKAIDMFKKQYWSHYGPTGETPWQFINDSGYTYTFAGENLAKDFTSADSVHTAWMNSSGHRANLLKPEYLNIGIAAVSGKQICDGLYPNFQDNTLKTCLDTTIVVQMFGDPSADINTAPTTIKNNVSSNNKVQNNGTDDVVRPQITEPLNNVYINSNAIDIKGTAPENNEVTVYDGDTKVGTITADGGAFDMKEVVFDDGQHTISATSKTLTGAVSKSSDPVNITVDTIKPVLLHDTAKIIKNEDGSYNIQIQASDDTVSITASSGVNGIDLQKQGNVFAGDLFVSSGNVGVALSAYDRSGNKAIDIVALPDIYLDSQSTANTFLGLTNKSIKQVVNISFALILLAFFIFEVIFIFFKESKAGKNPLDPKLNQYKYLSIHHTVPIAVVLVALVLTVSGNII
ncbi:MAG: CAP domain-containing protein [bacterium]